MKTAAVRYWTEQMETEDLALVRDFALKIFERHPYMQRFKELLVGIALCQGAANHYAICKGMAKRYADANKSGMKDIDVWFFFKKTDGSVFNNRWRIARDLGETKFGKDPGEKGYIGRRVDFFGRSIDADEANSFHSIRRWVTEGPWTSPIWIRQKVVVGLYPDTIFDKFIWVNDTLV
jgi:hypothetical protein